MYIHVCTRARTYRHSYYMCMCVHMYVNHDFSYGKYMYFNIHVNFMLGVVSVYNNIEGMCTNYCKYMLSPYVYLISWKKRDKKKKLIFLKAIVLQNFVSRSTKLNPPFSFPSLQFLCYDLIPIIVCLLKRIMNNCLI